MEYKIVKNRLIIYKLNKYNNENVNRLPDSEKERLCKLGILKPVTNVKKESDSKSGSTKGDGKGE